MIKEFGPEVAKQAMDRLADIQASEDILKIPLGQPQVMLEAGGEIVRVEFSQGRYMEFGPNHRINPIKDGKLDWSAVSRVKLLRFARGK